MPQEQLEYVIWQEMGPPSLNRFSTILKARVYFLGFFLVDSEKVQSRYDYWKDPANDKVQRT